MEFLTQIVYLFLFSFPILFLFKYIKIPNIIGFILIGILIGPHGFKIIQNTENIDVLAEIGIVLILFFIGLELSFTKLNELKKYVLILGSSQLLFTILLGYVITSIFHGNLGHNIFIGMAISISSTAIILNILKERKEFESPQGNVVFSISLMQDIAVLPMLIFLPILGNNGSTLTTIAIFTKIAYSVGFIVLIVVLGKFIIPKAIFQFAKAQNSEIFTIGILLVILSSALLTNALGFSLAIGAFIAGLLLSDSDFNHQIIADILPFKNVLNIFFFVSVGLLLDLSFFVRYLPEILVVTSLVILGKFLIVLFIVRLYRFPLRIALISAVLLAQIGEFSFLLIKESKKYSILNTYDANILTTSIVISMLISPLIILITSYLISRRPNLVSTKTAPKENTKEISDHVIIVGYGVNGKNVVRVLKETGIKYVIIELNPDTVKSYRANEKIIFGDATRNQILQEAGIKKACVLVITISDNLAANMVLRTAKNMNPAVHTIIRTRFMNEVQKFMDAGANVVIPEEFETSLQIFSKVLEKYHIPFNIIVKQTSIIRNESYLFLRNEDTKININSIVENILAQGITEALFIPTDSHVAGKKLMDIDLRAKTNTTIIAIVRNGETISNPGGDEKIMKGDTLVITGTHIGVDMATELLTGHE